MKRLIVKGISTAMLVTVLVFPPVTSAFAHTSPPPNTCEQTNALEIPGNAAECFSMPKHMNNPMGGGMMGGMMGGM